MSAQVIGEKLAVSLPQALGARDFMIERLILVSLSGYHWFLPNTFPSER